MQSCSNIVSSSFHFYLFICHIYHFYKYLKAANIQYTFLPFSPQQEPCEVNWAEGDWPKVTQLAFMAKAGLELMSPAF